MHTTWPKAVQDRDEAAVSQREAEPASADQASTFIQALSAEHWSLLTTRSLIYNESFSRVEIFLALLTGAVIGLALLAQVDHYHDVFTVAAILILFVVLLVGLTTVGRLSTLNRDDLLTVVGMNRLRRGYLEVHPQLDSYFQSASHDDLHGLMQTMHMDMGPGRWRVRDTLHGLQTLPVMLGVIDSVVAGVLAALIAVLVGASTSVAVVTGSAAFLAAAISISFWTRKSFDIFARTLPSRFPTPGGGVS